MAQIPRSVVRFNQRFNNPAQMHWAPYLPPWAVIEHTGRRSGKVYSTPVLAGAAGGVLYVPVLYGEGSDWVRNLLAAGGGGLRRRGGRYRLADPALIDAAQASGVIGPRVGGVSGRVLRASIVSA